MRFLQIFFITFLILTVSSCARIYRDNTYLADRDNTYLKAKTIPPLNIPPGLDSSSIHADYPISDMPYTTSAENVSLVPPGLYPAK
jgi:uncharacterized lipoprotein